jgi:hypothetical protein
MHALPEIEPRLPFVGPDTIWKVRSHVSASEPDRGTLVGVPKATDFEVPFAVGAVFALTVTVTVASSERRAPSETLYPKESGPE